MLPLYKLLFLWDKTEKDKIHTMNSHGKKTHSYTV